MQELQKDGPAQSLQFQENTNVSKKVLSQSKNENLSTVSQGQISKEWPNILNYFKTKGKIMLYTNLLNTNAPLTIPNIQIFSYFCQNSS